MRKRILSVLLVLAMLTAAPAAVFAADSSAIKTAGGADVAAAMEQAAAYVYGAVKEPVVASVGGEWAIIGLARAGYPVSQSYYDQYYETVVKALTEADGVLHARKYTEYSRVILALTAIGKDVTNVGGYNLLERLADFEAVKWQGINGPIFALIALDSHDYEIPQLDGVSVQTTRERLIEEILSREITTAEGVKGGFSLTDEQPDADITGMALAALARYQDRAEVKAASERALAVLDSMEREDGGFDSWGVINSESIAQVVVGKAALFAEGGFADLAEACEKNADALLNYQLGDGSFEHVLKKGTDQMACEQGLYALAAYVRAAQGKPGLYDMRDVTIAAKAAAPSGITVTLGGTPVAYTEASGQPFVDENNRAQVPLRQTMEAYGCRVSWDNAARTAVVEKDGTVVKVPAGRLYIWISKDGGTEEQKVIDTSAQIMDGRIYLPIRAVLEAFGANVSWDEKAKTVFVK